MVNYLREIVSGKKARFVDHETNLDLVYVTDRILIMGWPATGIASVYRNKRQDVLKFINSRHGDKWWIWNLCPLYENAYSPESMNGRVSRYPFPDHHAPPLSLLPLAVAEMNAWLDADPERVAIIHCKAGKGRSGTLLCSYMLSLNELPPPPMLDRSYSQKELAKQENKIHEHRAGWVVVGGADAVAQVPADENTPDDIATPDNSPGPASVIGDKHATNQANRGLDGGYLSRQSTPQSLSTLSRSSTSSGPIVVTSTPGYEPIAVGDDDGPGTAGQQDRNDGKVDTVFKLHSSRRMKPSSTGRGVSIASQRRWVRYVHLLFTKQAPASYLSSNETRVRLVSITMYLTPPTGWKKPFTSMVVGSDAGRGKAWASVARYDDEYVKELESKGKGGVTWGGVAGEGRYDSHKMFKSCGKMIASDVPQERQEEDRVVHHLVPKAGHPLVLDRAREMKIKFHLGSLPLGWAWLIPAFHLPEPIPPTNRTHELRFPRSQIDFPLGPGQAVEEIVVRLEEIPASDAASTAPLLSEQEEKQEGLDDRRGEGSTLDKMES